MLFHVEMTENVPPDMNIARLQKWTCEGPNVPVRPTVQNRGRS
jgi:muconolactone delta-isomerase